MQVRTQLAVVAVIALGWSAGNAASVQPVVASTSPAERAQLSSLESSVARNRDDVRAVRALAERYNQQHMWRLTVDTVNRTTPAVQQDGRVSLLAAVATEYLGDVQAAAARINGAFNRCQTQPLEFAEALGCDVRTQTELALESAALDRMAAWGITPVTDPDRTALAHELASRPVTVARSFAHTAP